MSATNEYKTSAPGVFTWIRRKMGIREALSGFNEEC